MQSLTDLIRTDSAILFPQRQVLFNPGIIGTLQPYYDMSPNLICAMETCFVVDSLSGRSLEECFPGGIYDSRGYYGSFIDAVLRDNVTEAKYPRTAVLVHGVHDTNVGLSNYQASEEVLRGMIRALVQRGIGATFFNGAGYTQFTYGIVAV